MRRFWALLLVIMLMCSGCGLNKSSEEVQSKLDFTIVERSGIPTELMKTINSEKEQEFSLSANIGEYTYIVRGYGSQPTGGYSIRVNEVYETSEQIHFSTNLVGPSAGEAVNKMTTYPFIVIKVECSEKEVIFE